MNDFKITFSDGNVIYTGFNGTLKEAENYYLNHLFEMDENKPMVKGVKVERLEAQTV